MKCGHLVGTVAVALLAAGASGAVPEGPAVYTSEDLDRMFGPAPRSPSEPVDKSQPEDWLFVQQFIDRQYSRIDADRRYDLDSRAVGVAEARTVPGGGYSPYAPYYHGVSLGLGYPASTWWSNVYASYTGDDDDHRHPRRSTMSHESWRRDGPARAQGPNGRSHHARGRR